ncbi:MAG: hypothetical protein CME64_11890 [Halobacteriovoraceae bacterium]|nr:hypothetical protein [Halobacteriovoraceae bacterium]|tara:strand:+ start:125492 stop:125965 length:474 start_codon:yes stop_codon:yes gene_type:complete
MASSYIILFSVLALIVLALSVYLGVLYGKLRAQKQAKLDQDKRVEELLKEREETIIESLDTIALALSQGQCEPTEGCIRIKRLVDEIEVLRDEEGIAVFHEMYEEVKHFATLQDYKDLSKQEAFEQDNKRYAIEEKYNQRIIKASKNLRDLISKKRA